MNESPGEIVRGRKLRCTDYTMSSEVWQPVGGRHNEERRLRLKIKQRDGAAMG